MRHCVDICLEIVFFKWGNLVWMNGFGKKGLGKKGVGTKGFGKKVLEGMVSGRMGHETRSCLLPPYWSRIFTYSLYIELRPMSLFRHRHNDICVSSPTLQKSPRGKSPKSSESIISVTCCSAFLSSPNLQVSPSIIMSRPLYVFIHSS